MPGKISKLSDLERVVLRNGYIYAKGRGSKFSQTEKLQELRRVGCKIGKNKVSILSAARDFVSNTALRSYLPLKVTPCVVDGLIPKEMLVELQKYVKAKISPTLSLSRGTPLNELIRSGKTEYEGQTHGVVFDITSYRNAALTALENIALDLMRKQLLEVSNSATYNRKFIEEFDLQVDKNRLPQNLSIAWYQKGKAQGMTCHKDHWSMYGAVICVVFESACGNLRIEEIGLNGPLTEGSLILINPATLHEIPVVVRDSRRAVIVVTI